MRNHLRRVVIKTAATITSILTMVVTNEVHAQSLHFDLHSSSSLSTHFKPGLNIKSIIFDIDGDGDDDVLHIGDYDSNLNYGYIYLNDGSGRFTAGSSVPNLAIIGAEDWDYPIFEHANVDGLPGDELFIGGNNGPADSILNITGQNTYYYVYDSVSENFVVKDSSFQQLRFAGLSLVDLDGDDHLDMFITGLHGSGQVYYNDGSGLFDSTYSISSFAGANLNAFSSQYSDSLRDVAIGGFSSVDIYQYNENTSQFTLKNSFAPNLYGNATFADFNGDGSEDLMISGEEYFTDVTLQNKLYLSDGNGSFSSSNEDFDGLLVGGLHFFGDLDGDDVAEIILYEEVGDSSDIIHVFWNDGTGVTTHNEIGTVYSNHHLETGDLNNDGFLDLLITGQDENGDADLRMYVNSTEGSFEPFTSLTSSNINVSSQFFDADNDGDIDLLRSGSDGDSIFTILEVNNGQGAFTAISPSSFSSVHFSAMAIGDVDKNGQKDVLLSGQKQNEELVTQLYLNNDLVFTISPESFIGLKNGDVELFDANGNGWEDMLIHGEDSSGTATVALYLSDTLGGFDITPTGIIPVRNSSSDIADIDNDGDLDLVISGTDSLDSALTAVYLNDGSGMFTKSVDTSLMNSYNSKVRYMEVNGDSLPDLLIVGNDNSSLYWNNGDGTFVHHQSLEALSHASLEFNDIDHDLDMDVVLTGSKASTDEVISYLYINEDGTFSKDSGFSVRAVNNGSVHLVDLEGDSRSDVYLIGEDEFGILAANTYLNKTCYPHLTHDTTVTIQSMGNFQFDGAYLFSSGTYEAVFTNRFGCDSAVTLHLSIVPHVSLDQVDPVQFELILPDSAPQIRMDLVNTRFTENLIYDMDGDGDQDLLQTGAVSEASNMLNFQSFIYLNDGFGNLVRKEGHAALGIEGMDKRAYPILRHGDLNGDGIEDLIMAGIYYSMDYVPQLVVDPTADSKIFFGDENANLTLQSHIALPDSITGLEILDIEHDGDMDILLGHRSGMNLFRNSGQGNFELDSSFYLEVEIQHLAVSPVDANGYYHIVADPTSPNRNVLYLYNGIDSAIYFNKPKLYGKSYNHYQFADVDADGDYDLFTGGNVYTFSIPSDNPDILGLKLHINNGDGTYTRSDQDFNRYDGDGRYGSDLDQFISEDLDNDGAAELVVLNRNSLDSNFNKLAIYWNDGSGNYTVDDSTYTGKLSFSDITASDFNSDGFIDLMITGKDGYENNNPIVYINNQSNGFDELAYHELTDIRSGDVKFHDIDFDGDKDLLMSGAYWQTSYDKKTIGRVYRNSGDGHFDLAQTNPFGQYSNCSFELADFNGDGIKDMIIIGEKDTLEAKTSLFWMDSLGNFVEDETNDLIDVASGQLKVFDSDNDGDQDILYWGKDTTGTGRTSFYLNDGSGIFTKDILDFNVFTSMVMDIGRIDSDTLQDIISLGRSGGKNVSNFHLSVLGHSFLRTDLSEFIPPAAYTAIKIIDVDGDSRNDVYVAGGGHQTIYLNDTSAFLKEHQVLQAVNDASVEFSDFDNDGDQDFVVSGTWPEFNDEPRTFLHLNDGNGYFTRSELTQFAGIRDAAFAIDDIDGDMDKDLIMAGYVFSDNDIKTRIYRNITTFVDKERITINACSSVNAYGYNFDHPGKFNIHQQDSSGSARVDLTVNRYDNVWDSAKWCTGSFPVAGQDVFIADHFDSTAFVCNDLIIDDSLVMKISAGSFGNMVVHGDILNRGFVGLPDAVSLVNYGNIRGTGTFGVERQTSHDKNTGKYSFIGSPIRKGKVDSLGKVVYAYDETVPFKVGGSEGLNSYKRITTETMEVGRAYASAFTGHVTFEGIPNTGNIAVEISKTDYPASDDNQEGFNMVANPYPCAIDFTKFIQQNIYDQLSNPDGVLTGNIWVWDDNKSHQQRGSSTDYLTINALGVVGGSPKNNKQWSGHLGTAQGFFVKVSADDSVAYGDHKVVFNNEMKVQGYNGDSTFFRHLEAQSFQRVYLSLSDENNSYDETLIGFTADATREIDALYDALKIDPKDGLRLYSKEDDATALAIQGLPGTIKSVPLGFNSDQAGILTISVNKQDYHESSIWLKDHLEDAVIELSETKSYAFYSKEGAFEDRFSLIFGTNESPTETLLKSTVVIPRLYASNGTMHVTYIEPGTVFQLRIHDLSGKHILTLKDQQSNQSYWSRSFESLKEGVYIIQLESGEEVIRKKLIFD